MKKVILIALPVVILGVGVGLVMTGVVKIPGMGAKPKAKAAQLYTEGKDPKVVDANAKKTTPAVSTVAATTKTNPLKTPVPPKVEANLIDNKPEVGQKKLAKLWNEVEAASLLDMTKDWKEAELAPVLLKMNGAKVAEFLALLDSKKASSLSREIQKQASLIPRPTGT